MYQIWCQSVEQFDSFHRHLKLWPPTPPPPMPPGPGVLWGDLYLPYVHSQMNPQTWTKVGANRFSRLTASPEFWMFDPLKLPSAPPLCLEGQFVWRISIPRWICTCVPNFVPIGPTVWQLQQTFEFVTPWNPQNAPWDIEGRIVFSLCPFPDESADVYQIWFQSVQPFDSFPKHLNLWPPKNPRNAPGVLWGELYLAYVHSQTNPPTCTKFGANRCSRLTASPDFWMCDPLNPMPPGLLMGDLYLAYVHSQMSPQTWTKVGANRTASPYFFNCWPPKTPLCLEGQFAWRISIPIWICTCVPNLVPIGPAVW